ncbi:heme/copper-type cytochrome/quinol oxidase subunit 2 [Paenibacillus anaericanus]|uniref:DUF2500 domain-containing protein n=1 Tax=Paenibacillus anaericanus TaxID=170367 RepID=A0A3S1BRV1_9BACL|nr:DUF2500 domain-containing protein [Paenibacillus anaericanus]MDQ0087673.1 heme/copper-type cytochrome/quinol oxidase subunit 2 [Paenibacillus anaericanus]RUT48039.1 DUF2500 domain-containing protein [Paenibacillus anaericanus]
MQSWGEMFGVMNMALPIFIVVILAIISVSVASGMKRYLSNNRQPELAVHSIIVGKRTEVTHRYSTETSVNRTDSKYYLTFEVDSGDRLEFTVSGQEFGQSAEGDEGQLTFKGSRYLGFDRQGRIYRPEQLDYREYRRSL